MLYHNLKPFGVVDFEEGVVRLCPAAVKEYQVKTAKILKFFDGDGEQIRVVAGGRELLLKIGGAFNWRFVGHRLCGYQGDTLTFTVVRCEYTQGRFGYEVKSLDGSCILHRKQLWHLMRDLEQSLKT
jgi:hypothetical protein